MTVVRLVFEKNVGKSRAHLDETSKTTLSFRPAARDAARHSDPPMLRRQPSRIELKPEDKDEVRRSCRRTRESSARSRPAPPPRLPILFPQNLTSRPPRSPQYEESRKAHIRKLQNDLARANADSLDNANRFQFNAGEPTKEERIGLNR
jgi:hypothetical protein